MGYLRYPLLLWMVVLAATVLPAQVVINEIAYHPESDLDGDEFRNGLDDSRNREEALAFDGDGGSPICGIVSTIREVMAFVIEGDAAARLANTDVDADGAGLAGTGVESGPLFVVGFALLGAGAVFTLASHRRRRS